MQLNHASIRLNLAIDPAHVRVPPTEPTDSTHPDWVDASPTDPAHLRPTRLRPFAIWDSHFATTSIILLQWTQPLCYRKLNHFIRHSRDFRSIIFATILSHFMILLDILKIIVQSVATVNSTILLQYSIILWFHHSFCYSKFNHFCYSKLSHFITKNRVILEILSVILLQ
jgi:hypothetical protein